MTAAPLVALAAMLVFAAIAPVLGRRLPPSIATRVLAPGSLLVAASTVFVLGVVAFTWLGQLTLVARLGRWSASTLDAHDPVPESLAIVSMTLLIAACACGLIRSVRRIRALIDVYRAYSGTHAGELIVVDSARPEAFATPSPAGRIVVTSTLLQALNPTERRVVLAHERAHLDHWHTWWALAADIAAAINPLLRPTARAVSHAIERWADEDAAAVVGDRQLVARTIARAALLKHDALDHSEALAATGGDVPQRVRALLGPTPRRRPFALAALSVVLLASVLATAVVEHQSDAYFDQAAIPSAHHH